MQILEITNIHLFVIWAAVIMSVVFVISGIDDLFIDLVSIVRGLRPREIIQKDLLSLATQPEKCLAIMIPAWDEGAILEPMIVGNLNRIRYDTVHIFLGVYPNDPETIAAADRARKRLPQIHVVVNSREGPTSKGQMLNEIIRAALDLETTTDVRFDAFVMQDAEDLIHPWMFRLMNANLDRFDFIQTPVFSLPVSPWQMVGGTYMDEFAEQHTKDLLVRARLGGGVPSAGVGTALSRVLVNRLLEAQGVVFSENSLTEDYELGLSTAKYGARSTFLCHYFCNPDTSVREFVATREYFPKRIDRSIRQKTRWTIGIVFQGWKHMGWFGSTATRYFLWRDRKGIVTNPLTFLGYIILGLSLLLGIDEEVLLNVSGLQPSHVEALGLATGFFMLNRLLQRTSSTIRVYGWAHAALLPLRWPLAIFINAVACFRSIRQFSAATWGQKKLAWAKTEHEIPLALVHEAARVAQEKGVTR